MLFCYALWPIYVESFFEILALYIMTLLLPGAAKDLSKLALHEWKLLSMQFGTASNWRGSKKKASIFQMGSSSSSLFNVGVSGPLWK